TMVLARLDWRRGQIMYSNGGHFVPFIHRANGRIEQLSVGGPILGALPQARFEGATLEFSPTDILVGYSDGLIECRNANDEEFGMDRLLDAVRRSANLCGGGALFSIVGAAQGFAAGAPRRDDMTLMIVAGAEANREGGRGLMSQAGGEARSGQPARAGSAHTVPSHLLVTDRAYNPDETLLIHQAQAGRWDAFAELAGHYDAPILALALRLTGSEREASRLFQTIFTRAYEDLRGYRFRCSFYLWIYRIVVRSCIHFLQQ